MGRAGPGRAWPLRPLRPLNAGACRRLSTRERPNAAAKERARASPKGCGVSTEVAAATGHEEYTHRIALFDTNRRSDSVSLARLSVCLFGSRTASLSRIITTLCCRHDKERRRFPCLDFCDCNCCSSAFLSEIVSLVSLPLSVRCFPVTLFYSVFLFLLLFPFSIFLGPPSCLILRLVCIASLLLNHVERMRVNPASLARPHRPACSRACQQCALGREEQWWFYFFPASSVMP
jgi:hypothetical protein